MPKSYMIVIAIIAVLMLSSCAKRNTEYQEEDQADRNHPGFNRRADGVGDGPDQLRNR